MKKALSRTIFLLTILPANILGMLPLALPGCGVPPPPNNTSLYLEVAKIAASLAQIPGILSANSDDTKSLRLGAALTGLPSAGFFAYDIARKRSGYGACLAKEAVYDFPKEAIALWCIAYDLYKFQHADEISAQNKESKKQELHGSISQGVLLAVEIFLRGLSTLQYYQQMNTPHHDRINNYINLADLTSEFADWVELSRLLTRPSLGPKWQEFWKEKKDLMGE
jgi:hypothetical protein